LCCTRLAAVLFAESLTSLTLDLTCITLIIVDSIYRVTHFGGWNRRASLEEMLVFEYANGSHDDGYSSVVMSPISAGMITAV